MGPHCTGTPTPPKKHATSLYRVTLFPPLSLLETPGDQDWIPVQSCSLEIPQLVLTSGDQDLETCSNLFTWGPHWYWHLVPTEAHTVGKQAICILLECFLVSWVIIIADSNPLPLPLPQSLQTNKFYTWIDRKRGIIVIYPSLFHSCSNYGCFAWSTFRFPWVKRPETICSFSSWFCLLHHVPFCLSFVLHLSQCHGHVDSISVELE